MDALFKINSIVSKYLKNCFEIFSTLSISYEPLWLLQPKKEKPQKDKYACDDDWEDSKIVLDNNLELIQNSCKYLTGNSISYIYNCAPCMWDNVSGKYDELIDILSKMSGESAKEMILNEEIAKDSDNVLYSDNSMLLTLRQKTRMLAEMRECLDRGEADEFNSVLDDMMGFLCSNHYISMGIRNEIYYSVALVFQSYINRFDIDKYIGTEIDLSKLMNIEGYVSLDEIRTYFFELSELIFNFNGINSDNRIGRIIQKLHNYIDMNLDKDLSIVALADYVNFNQSYLSRLYKQRTGISLSDHIIKVKLNRAYEYLNGKKHKINEIAQSLGFTSHACFSRFFKRYTGLSPSEYMSSGTNKI
jgi:two-component system response regulator YesN